MSLATVHETPARFTRTHGIAIDSVLTRAPRCSGDFAPPCPSPECQSSASERARSGHRQQLLEVLA